MSLLNLKANTAEEIMIHIMNVLIFAPEALKFIIQKKKKKMSRLLINLASRLAITESVQKVASA